MARGQPVLNWNLVAGCPRSPSERQHQAPDSGSHAMENQDSANVLVPALFDLVEREISGETIATVNARDLHAFLGVGKDFSTWIKDRIAAYEFKENQDFVCSPILGSEGRGGHNRLDYFASLDMAKELAMVERNAKGKEARQYFLECERRMKAQSAPKPMTMAEMLLGQAQLLVEVERRQAALDAEQRELDRRQAVTERRLDQIETASDWFTAIGYARWAKQTSLDLKSAAKLGGAASRLCKQLGIEPSQIPDPRFGVVNQYPKSVLDEAWSSVFGGAQ